MPKLVCTKCETELYPKKNEVYVVETASFGPYKLWSADLWECKGCGFQIVSGFGNNPIAEHYQRGFAELLKNLEESGSTIFYDNERPQ